MPIIEVNHVTKEYRLGQLQSLKHTLQRTAAKLRGHPLPERPLFKALDNVDFKVEQGEVLGIIGHNGAGKSTLLKMLAQISVPTRGSVKVHGKVAPLIEVGAGLIGDLTGRENVFVNGAILGIPKAEIRKKFDEIVAFAELEEFIDTPIKRYSSGMSVRLGFAIATSIDADILIVDEVLAVGDLAFQRKCFDRMEKLIRAKNRTVLVVGHNVRQLEQICTRLILMDHGRVHADGLPDAVSNLYFRKSNDKTRAALDAPLTQVASDELLVHAVEIRNDAGIVTDTLGYQSSCVARIRFTVREKIERLVFFVSLHTADFVRVTANENFTAPCDFTPGDYFMDMRVPSLEVLPGVYALRVWIGTVDGQVKFSAENLSSFQVVSDDFAVTRLQDLGLFQLTVSWEVFANKSSNIPKPLEFVC